MGQISVTIAEKEPAAKPESTPPRSRKASPTQQPSPSESTARPAVYLDADERTNRIIDDRS